MRSDSILRDRGAFLAERYWYRRAFPYVPGYTLPCCVDRNGVERKEHAEDNDGRCVFCDRLTSLAARCGLRSNQIPGRGARLG